MAIYHLNRLNEELLIPHDNWRILANMRLALRARRVKIIFLECSYLIHLFGQRSKIKVIGPTVWAGGAVTD